MTPPKRKRIPTRNPTNKRPKYTQPYTSSDSSSSSSSSSGESDSDESEHNSQEEWEALRILDQTGQGFGLRYLIEWAGIDPATGNQWEPSWVKARNASDGLRIAWRKQQASKIQEEKRATAAAKRSKQQRNTHPVTPARGATSKGSSRRRIAESTETSSSSSEEGSSVKTRHDTEAPTNSVTFGTGASVSRGTTPQVAVDVRGGSFNRGEYELHAEIPESQASSRRATTEDTDLESSQLFASQPTFRVSGVVPDTQSSQLFAPQPTFRVSGVVPDTQSSRGDVSYIPVTQEDLGSSIYSDTTNESGDHIVGYSGLLGTNEQPTLAARAQSPATSIAETVLETTQDLRSQRHLESEQEQSGVPDTSTSTAVTGATPTQDDLSSHQADSASRSLHDAQDPQDKALSIAIVENSTHLEPRSQGSLIQKSQQPPCITGRQLTPASTQPRSQNFSAHPVPSQEESATELLAVADTPQISQHTFTAAEDTTRNVVSHSTQHFESTGPSIGNLTQVSVTEGTVLEENAQFAFQSQRPAFFDPITASKPTLRALTEPPRPSKTRESDFVRLSEGPSSNKTQEGVPFRDSEDSTTIDEISQPLQQSELHSLIQEDHSPSPIHVQQGDETFCGPSTTEIGIVTSQLSAAVESRPPTLYGRSIDSREHNAQVLHSGAFLTNQEGPPESVVATVEIDTREAITSKNSSPCSRHDSSQDTPERRLQSAEHSSSPIPLPPSYSLRTLDSNVPIRPATPVLFSSSTRMADKLAESSADKAGQRLEELMASQAAKNPYVPRKPRRVPQAPLGLGMTSGSPIINVSAEGTRSPSTVPDRSPAPPVQTSLRTVAFANANDKPRENLLDNPLAATSTYTDAGPTKEKADLVAAVAAGTAADVPEASTMLPAIDMVEEMDDDDDDDDDQGVEYDDDDNDSYNDDLQDHLHLEKQEFIVPLFIDGRQKDTYTAYLEQKTELLNKVLDSVMLAANPAPDNLDEVEKVLTYLKNVEDHPDLIYAEAESATGFDVRSATDVQHGAQFGIDNSVKFRFLGQLFDQLRKRSMHIVLLLESDDAALFNILRTFLAAAAHSYEMPTRGFSSHASNDVLKITVLPRTVSAVIQRADLAICLNGVQTATQVRQKDWAIASGNLLPVLHLVIPQTVGHIERYLLSDLPKRSRIENILTVLGQIEARNDIGNQIDIDTPNAVEAARLVASWLAPDDDQESPEWPLPSIGSARSFMDYDATQQSERSAASSPAPERTKRALETDEPDAAKRMRYTPQAPVVPDSSALQDPEVTRVSDSMPGSAATENARLANSLERLKSELIQVQREHREEQVMWDRQQTEHENRQQQYRTLFNEKAEVDRAHESMTRTRDKLRAQLDAQVIELRTIRSELDAQRVLGLASSDSKDVEITRLRTELEAAHLERDKAQKSVLSNERTLDYTKEQYRTASDAAGRLSAELSTLQEQNAKLSHQASGEVAKLKQLHLDRSMKNAIQQNNILKTENSTLKAALKQREEELLRAKNNSGRAAYGTRAQSTTPQPKTRSRAASPERGGRAPRGGGRISNLVAEER